MDRFIRTMGFVVFAPLALADCSGSTRLTECSDDEVLCGEACTSTDTDPANCGACGVACEAGETCEDGVCGGGCPEGTSPCGSDPASCVDLSSDPENCGACGSSCGGRVCEGGECGDICDQWLTECDGRCVDTRTDEENCGSCGEVCDVPGAEVACVDAVCEVSCPAGFAECDGLEDTVCETDTSTDADSCGECGNVCAADIDCVAGSCFSPGVLCGGVSCAEGELCCRTGGGMGGGSTCYDPDTQACTGAVVECDGSEDCAEGELCCQDPESWDATCASDCDGLVRCSQSSDCPERSPFCCPTGHMSTINLCLDAPC
jgi:hypothetical protein